MEKRVIIAFVLSFAVLYAFRELFSPPQPPAQPAPVAKSGAASPANSPSSAPGGTPAQTALPPAEPTADIRSEKAEEFVFDTALYTARISNIGGALKSYELKEYSDAEGHPIELINQTAGTKVGWPLALVTGDAMLDETLAKAAFAGRREGERFILEFAAEGVHARKTVRFDREKYGFSLETSLTKDGGTIGHSVAWSGDFGDQSAPPDPAKKNAIYQLEGKFRRLPLRSITDPQEFTTARASVEDQYFLAMFLMDNAAPVRIAKQEYTAADGKAVPTLVVSARASEGKPMRVFVGPKHSDWLAKADPQLTSVIDYGWFEFIARPLVYGLLLLHRYIGSFGWAIVILTLAINLVLFPLRLKQQVSMQKMAKVQPHMKRLQDQYKKLKAADPRRAQVQSEMMNVYKEHGVNPMGGCLPLLLQMPVLFGFYNALYYSIELRRAPFLWIDDLSQADFVFGVVPILPILMAISMVVMQKLTPTTVDPAQAKMMMIMPLMFTVLFIYQSAGLVLYWLTSNVAGIAQQVFINKYWSPQAEASLKPRPKTKERSDK